MAKPKKHSSQDKVEDKTEEHTKSENQDYTGSSSEEKLYEVVQKMEEQKELLAKYTDDKKNMEDRIKDLEEKIKVQTDQDYNTDPIEDQAQVKEPQPGAWKAMAEKIKDLETTVNNKTNMTLQEERIKQQTEKTEEKIKEHEVRVESITKTLEKYVNITEAQGSKSGAMCAYKKFVDNPKGEGLSPKNVIIYDKVYTESNMINSTFDASKGEYTAGITGVYKVSASAEYGRTHDSDYLAVDLDFNSDKYQSKAEGDFMFQENLDATSLSTPISATRYITLEKGEKIWLQYNCSGNCTIYSLKTCVVFYGDADEHKRKKAKSR